MQVVGSIAGIVAAVAMLAQLALAAAPAAKKLLLTGTVMAIFRVEAAPPSRRNWGVTVQVERVKAGKYTDPTFTFRVHSPARAGLEVGVRYTIEATWNGREYEVDETRPIHRERTRP
jgi:hypothetical protein